MSPQNASAQAACEAAPPEAPALFRALADDPARSTYLETLLQAMCEGVLALDRHRRVLYWSPSCERLTGRAAATAIGRKAAEVLGPLAARLEEVEEGTTEGFLQTAEERIPVRLRVVRVPGPSGISFGSVCAVTDLRATWQEHAARERESALAELGQGVAWAVHQIRNPLGAAAGFAELLERDLPDGDEGQLLAKIRECLAEVHRRVGDILSYARPGALAISETDLCSLLDSAVETVRARFTPGPKWGLDLPPAARVLADALALREAIENLLVNAAEASGAAGTVTLMLQSRTVAGGGYRLLIRNTGGDLAPEKLDSLFEPFVSTKTGGSGLGLPLARRTVRAHGGDIQALSAGGSTTFVVTLPDEPRGEPPCDGEA